SGLIAKCQPVTHISFETCGVIVLRPSVVVVAWAPVVVALVYGLTGLNRRGRQLVSRPRGSRKSVSRGIVSPQRFGRQGEPRGGAEADRYGGGYGLPVLFHEVTPGNSGVLP